MPQEKWEERLNDLLEDFGKGVYYEFDPRRFNGTTKPMIIDFIRQARIDAVKEAFGKLEVPLEADSLFVDEDRKVWLTGRMSASAQWRTLKQKILSEMEGK